MDITQGEHKFSVSLAEAILEATGNGILIIDNNRKIIKHNSQFTELWNIPPSLQHSNKDEAFFMYIWMERSVYPPWQNNIMLLKELCKIVFNHSWVLHPQTSYVR